MVNQAVLKRSLIIHAGKFKRSMIEVTSTGTRIKGVQWPRRCHGCLDAAPCGMHSHSFQEPRLSGYANNEGVTCGTASGIPSAFQSCGRTCLWYSDVITASWRKRKGGDRKEYKTREALACLWCLRRRLLECLWTRKQAQLNSRLKKSQFSFRRGCTYTDQILTLKRHNQTMVWAWKMSECAKWTIRKHNTYSRDICDTELLERLQREITGNGIWKLPNPHIGEMQITTTVLLW